MNRMYVLHKKVPVRNLLVGAGALYLFAWLAIPLELGFYKLTAGLIYRGQFNGVVVMPLVEHFPVALVAAAVGAAVIWLVESERPLVWTVFPALLYLFSRFSGSTGHVLRCFSTGYSKQSALYSLHFLVSSAV